VENMTIEQIKTKITELAKRHAAINEVTLKDFDDAELLEWQASGLIISYCEEKEYLINGFPTEKRKLSEEELDDEEYFCRERFDLYQDILTYQKDDVAELMWHFTESFWPDTFESKEDYIKSAQARAEDGGFYDVTL
jgi:hypothetical protein